MNAKKPTLPAVASAPPPIHSVLFVLVAGVLSLHSLPSLEDIDQVATIDTFTSSVLKDHDGKGIITPTTIATIRHIFSAFILGTTALRVMGKGIAPKPTYLPKSKLKSAPLRLIGLRSLAPFTVWCWVLLGFSFALSGTIPLLFALDRTDLISSWHMRLALLTFEMAAPCAFLVSTVVKYALWPHALKSGGSAGTTVFRSFYGLTFHNVNVIFVIFEVALLGGLPVEMSHVAVGPFLGLIYVIFAWWMSNRWDNDRGPQFLYFFLDTTLGWTTTFALLGLLIILLFFYALFSVVDNVLEHLEGGLPVHTMAVIIALWLACRFRD